MLTYPQPKNMSESQIGSSSLLRKHDNQTWSKPPTSRISIHYISHISHIYPIYIYPIYFRQKPPTRFITLGHCSCHTMGVNLSIPKPRPSRPRPLSRCRAAARPLTRCYLSRWWPDPSPTKSADVLLVKMGFHRDFTGNMRVDDIGATCFNGISWDFTGQMAFLGCLWDDFSFILILSEAMDPWVVKLLGLWVNTGINR